MMRFPVVYVGQVVLEYGGLYVVLGYDVWLARTLLRLGR